MNEFLFFVLLIALAIAWVLIMRIIGAWMLRINEILDNQCIIIDRLDEILDKMEKRLDKEEDKAEE